MPSPDSDPEWKTEILPYPLSPASQQELIALLRTEWTRTDYDWLEAMNGDYSAKLVIVSVLARRRGVPLATATIHFARHHPEVAVIGGVLTHRNHRDRGLAGNVLEVAIDQAKAAGCQVCLLGTARSPHNLYKHHGFAWQNGRVMRRALGAGDLEARYFAAGQAVTVRDATWGDLPGVSLFAAQPIALPCLDYPRGLFSGRVVPADRCLSNFPVLWYDTVMRGGTLAVLAGSEQERVLGFASLTPAPDSTRRHSAVVEFAAHDHYAGNLPALLDFVLAAARTHRVTRADAHVVASDHTKLDCLRLAGFSVVARLPGVLQLGGTATDVILLSRAL